MIDIEEVEKGRLKKKLGLWLKIKKLVEQYGRGQRRKYVHDRLGTKIIP
jgi:hypothetical protein